MGETCSVYERGNKCGKILVKQEKKARKKRLGRSRHRWKDNIVTDFMDIMCMWTVLNL
jgi:hypothetical protein